MAQSLKTLDTSDKRSQEKARLNQLIDIISSDLSTEANRRKYPSFTVGEEFPITSSLYNTVYDQDHTLQSSNALFDISFGVYAKTDLTNTTPEITGSTIITSLSTESKLIDSAGKYIFSKTESNMLREKINVYRQYAQILLGNSLEVFRTPHTIAANSTDETTQIKEALFINVRRLFKRDNLAKGYFGLKLYNRTCEPLQLDNSDLNALNGTLFTSPKTTGTQFKGRSKLLKTSANYTANQVLIIDTNASQSYGLSSAGEFATLKMYLGNETPVDCGLIFYDMGIVVLDVDKIFDLDDLVQGVFDFPDNATASSIFALSNGLQTVMYDNGKTAIGVDTSSTNGIKKNIGTLRKFLQLATIDDIIKHFLDSRFTDLTDTAIAFQNETIINSTIYFCRLMADEFNYSTNPTYTDENGKIIVINNVNTDKAFSYITTVGLHNNDGELLAVAKLSRPIEKNPNNELVVRVRLDY